MFSRTKTNFEMIKEFHMKFDPQVENGPEYSRERVILRSRLIFEEFREVLEELKVALVADIDMGDYSTEIKLFDRGRFVFKNETLDKQKVAKELADLLYVVYGSAYSMGIPMDDVFAEVHRSNMSKLGPNGEVILREDGKILKGPNYSPADLSKIVK